MPGLSAPRATARLLSRRALQELWALQTAMQNLAAHRNLALRLLKASRSSTTGAAQREFWLEFAWLDQEYRIAVRRLARFCVHHKDGATDWTGSEARSA